jgi:hypothetical protein
MTRNGKIARLPLDLREELNRRLLDGEPATKLAPWLNELPRVQKMLAEEFHGKPITKDNISAWKNGGFLEWKRERQVQDSVATVLGHSPAMVAAVQSGLADQMAVLLGAHMLVELKRLPLTTGSDEKAKLWRELRISVNTMKRYELASQRLKLNKMKARQGAEEAEFHYMTPPERDEAVKGILGLAGQATVFNQDTKTWEGPEADQMNEQARKLATGELGPGKEPA